MKLSKFLPLTWPLYRFCKEYCDRYHGENNDVMKTNGEWHFLKRHIKNCHTVFDVGANRGGWSKYALELNPTVELHCFEPIRDMFALLQKNNFPTNVHCNNFGLSSKKGSLDIYLAVQSLYARSGLNAGWGIKSPGEKEKVELTALDDYCREMNVTEIDFLKCDVEGHEHDVFQGSMEMLKSGKIKRIQFEYGGCNIDAHVFLKDIFEQFSNLHYSFYKIMPYQLVKIHEYDQRLDNFIYKNFALLHDSLIEGNA